MLWSLLNSLGFDLQKRVGVATGDSLELALGVKFAPAQGSMLGMTIPMTRRMFEASNDMSPEG
jgi:hypothetical protein